MRTERGQASIELLAGIPALLLAAVVALQILVTVYTLHLADNSAEAGALALAGGREAESAVLAALPGWARERVQTSAEGGRVAVRVRPPALLDAVSKALEVRSVAWARPAGG